MVDQQKIDDIERAKINMETAPIAWADLQRYFAAGNVVNVAADLDLVEVALQISKDNGKQIKAWMEQGKVGRVQDDQAREWFDCNAELWCVVVKPLVLVQDRG